MELEEARRRALESEEALCAFLRGDGIEVPDDPEQLIHDTTYWQAKDRAFVACRIEIMEKRHPPKDPPSNPDNKSFIPPKFFVDAPTPPPEGAVQKWMQTLQDPPSAGRKKTSAPKPTDNKSSRRQAVKTKRSHGQKTGPPKAAGGRVKRGHKATAGRSYDEVYDEVHEGETTLE